MSYILPYKQVRRRLGIGKDRERTKECGAASAASARGTALPRRLGCGISTSPARQTNYSLQCVLEQDQYYTESAQFESTVIQAALSSLLEVGNWRLQGLVVRPVSATG